MEFNTLTGPTFGWFKVNDGEPLDLPAMECLSPATELPEGVCVERLNGARVCEMRTGSDEEFGQTLAAARLPVLIYTVPVEQRTTERDALHLSFRLPGKGEKYDPKEHVALKSAETTDAPVRAGKFAEVELNPEVGGSLTAVMDYRSEEDAKGLAGVQARITTDEGVKLTLMQIACPGGGYTFLDDADAVCAKDAELCVIHLVLSGKHVCQGFSSVMEGDRSQVVADVGHVGEDHTHYDLNYESIHTGKKTGAEIYGRGILRGHVEKMLRGSIDLREGCSGSEGNETKGVFPMDGIVENRSSPVALCSEDDMVGNHGATIGRLDEDLLFYMESRDIQKDGVYEIMAKARIGVVTRKILDAKVRHDPLELDDEEEWEKR